MNLEQITYMVNDLFNKITELTNMINIKFTEFDNKLTTIERDICALNNPMDCPECHIPLTEANYSYRNCKPDLVCNRCCYSKEQKGTPNDDDNDNNY